MIMFLFPKRGFMKKLKSILTQEVKVKYQSEVTQAVCAISLDQKPNSSIANPKFEDYTLNINIQLEESFNDLQAKTFDFKSNLYEMMFDTYNPELHKPAISNNVSISSIYRRTLYLLELELSNGLILVFDQTVHTLNKITQFALNYLKLNRDYYNAIKSFYKDLIQEAYTNQNIGWEEDKQDKYILGNAKKAALYKEYEMTAEYVPDIMNIAFEAMFNAVLLVKSEEESLEIFDEEIQKWQSDQLSPEARQTLCMLEMCRAVRPYRNALCNKVGFVRKKGGGFVGCWYDHELEVLRPRTSKKYAEIVVDTYKLNCFKHTLVMFMNDFFKSQNGESDIKHTYVDLLFHNDIVDENLKQHIDGIADTKIVIRNFASRFEHLMAVNPALKNSGAVDSLYPAIKSTLILVDDWLSNISDYEVAQCRKIRELGEKWIHRQLF